MQLDYSYTTSMISFALNLAFKAVAALEAAWELKWTVVRTTAYTVASK